MALQRQAVKRLTYQGILHGYVTQDASLDDIMNKKAIQA
jgi:hypothetical protein